MTVFACKDNSPAGCTNRIGDKGVAEQHTFIGQPVNIGRFIPVRSIGADGLASMVISHDKNDIWLFRFLLTRQAQGQDSYDTWQNV
jgi:hypothetical protein